MSRLPKRVLRRIAGEPLVIDGNTLDLQVHAFAVVAAKRAGGGGEVTPEGMRTAFDQMVAPACPEQLTAPVLHRILKHPSVQPFVYGGKGVGSQGDGTIQFVARGATEQEQLVATLQDELHLPALKLRLGCEFQCWSYSKWKA